MRRCLFILILLSVFPITFAFADNGTQQVQIQQASQPPIVISIGSSNTPTFSVTPSENIETTYGQQRTDDFKAKQLAKLKLRFKHLEEQFEANERWGDLNRKQIDSLIMWATLIITVFAASAALTFVNLYDKAKQQAATLEEYNKDKLQDLEKRLDASYNNMLEKFQKRIEEAMQSIQTEGEHQLLQLVNNATIEIKNFTLDELDKSKTAINEHTIKISKARQEIESLQRNLMQEWAAKLTPENRQALDDLYNSNDLPEDIKDKSSILKMFDQEQWLEVSKAATLFTSHTFDHEMSYLAAASNFNYANELKTNGSHLSLYYYKKSLELVEKYTSQLAEITAADYYLWGYTLQQIACDDTDNLNVDLLLDSMGKLKQALFMAPTSIQCNFRLIVSYAMLARLNPQKYKVKYLKRTIKLVEDNIADQAVILKCAKLIFTQLKSNAFSDDENLKLEELTTQWHLKAEELVPGSGAYNLACLACRNNDLKECHKWLDKCLDYDYMPNYSHVATDEDLVAAHSEEWFQDLLQDLKVKKDATVSEGHTA